VGARTGETFRLGDKVEVKLVEAAPFAGALRFEMLSDGGATKSARRNNVRDISSRGKGAVKKGAGRRKGMRS
jgi:ribonuclease R